MLFFLKWTYKIDRINGNLCTIFNNNRIIIEIIIISIIDDMQYHGGLLTEHYIELHIEQVEQVQIELVLYRFHYETYSRECQHGEW